MQDISNFIEETIEQQEWSNYGTDVSYDPKSHTFKHEAERTVDSKEFWWLQ